MRIVKFFQLQLNETALFARRSHCHSVDKPGNPEAGSSLDTDPAASMPHTAANHKHRLRSATTAQETAMNYPTFRSSARSVAARTLAPRSVPSRLRSRTSVIA
jgi:hypothetical protein